MINIPLNGCECKIRRKTLARDVFLTEDEVLMGLKTLFKISVRDLYFVDLCSGVICVCTVPYRIADIT